MKGAVMRMMRVVGNGLPTATHGTPTGHHQLTGRLMRPLLGAAALLLLSASGIGCQNKLYDENASLRQQNRELQARLDERGQTSALVTPAPAPPAPVAVAPPAPAPVAPPAAPPAAPSLVAPAAPDKPFGDLETTVDAAKGTTTVNILGDALFDSGRTTLKESAKKDLDKVAATL